MSENTSIEWYEDFLGIAYRYFDIRMNIVLMFKELKPTRDLWYETMHWWNDHTIKIRFVETGDDYWFVMGADSRRPETNKYFYKIIPKSESYERFKKGHQGSAYMRFGIYSRNIKKIKNDALCDCGHRKDDHDEDTNACLYEVCECTKYTTFQLNILKKKKVVTNIKFLSEDDVKDDALAWNCLNRHKYSKTG